jgi:hypothetical protein
MATKRRPVDDEIEEVEELEVDEPEEPDTTTRRGGATPRMSITLPARMRKKIRLAAALADLDTNEWARVVLATAARKTVERMFPDKV